MRKRGLAWMVLAIVSGHTAWADDIGQIQSDYSYRNYPDVVGWGSYWGAAAAREIGTHASLTPVYDQSGNLIPGQLGWWTSATFAGTLIPADGSVTADMSRLRPAPLKMGQGLDIKRWVTEDKGNVIDYRLDDVFHAYIEANAGIYYDSSAGVWRGTGQITTNINQGLITEANSGVYITELPPGELPSPWWVDWQAFYQWNGIVTASVVSVNGVVVFDHGQIIPEPSTLALVCLADNFARAKLATTARDIYRLAYEQRDGEALDDDWLATDAL